MLLERWKSKAKTADDGRPWFAKWASNVTSQFGEDGIIARILEALPKRDHHCVEFGAWDGKTFSNTYNLIANRGYTALLIEGDVQRYKQLREVFAQNPRVTPVCAMVGFDKPHNLDFFLGQHGVPWNFDLLSIDIDGNDYHVWQAVIEYRPKLVVVEFNPTIPNEVEFVQARDNSVSQGSSIQSFVKMAAFKNYALIAATTTNAFFVDAQYLPRLKRKLKFKDNSVAALRTDLSAVTYLFCGYDGTVFVRGSGMMPWHQLMYEESKLQMLPASLRRYPHNYDEAQKREAEAFGVPPAAYPKD